MKIGFCVSMLFERFFLGVKITVKTAKKKYCVMSFLLFHYLHPLSLPI